MTASCLRFTAVLLTAASLSLGPARPAAASPVPRFDHVLVVVMENKDYNQAYLLGAYTRSFAAISSMFTQSYGVARPSQPNYLALWAGDILGVTVNDCPPPGSPWAVENLGHACEAAGLTWRSYNQDLPAVGSPICVSGPNSLYTRKHNPWTNFSNLDHNNERPYPDLQADINANTLPNLSFIVPNNCNNSHNTSNGCTVLVGDSWLSSNLPQMADAVGPRGLVILTWDEDASTAGNNNRILTVFHGDSVKSGYVTARPINHYTVLRTICEGLGLEPFGLAAAESSITDVWLDDSTTPVRFALERAMAQGGRVQLSWITSDPGAAHASIERRTQDRTWTRLADVSADGAGRIEYQDAEVVPGSRYAYRLVVDGHAQEETWVEVPRHGVVALEGARPNPVGGDLLVAFTLPAPSPARVELIDLAGRRVLARDLGTAGAGRHEVNLGSTARLGAGVYLVKLTHRDGELTKRAVVVR